MASVRPVPPCEGFSSSAGAVRPVSLPVAAARPHARPQVRRRSCGRASGNLARAGITDLDR
jgi:hypothetical protein